MLEIPVGDQVVRIDLLTGAREVRSVGFTENPTEKVVEYSDEPVPRKAYRVGDYIVSANGANAPRVRRVPMMGSGMVQRRAVPVRKIR